MKVSGIRKKTMQSGCWGLLIAAAFLCMPGGTRAEDVAAIRDRLHRAEALNRIDDASLNPWHLKLGFQLMDDKGHPSEQGTIEEWWRSPSQHKIVFTSPSYTSTEIQTADGLYRTKDMSSAPYLIELVLAQVVHPLVAQEIDSGVPELREDSFGKVQLDCIMKSQPRKNSNLLLGLFPTYCLDHDQETLRVVTFNPELILRNSIGVFQKHKVSLDQTIKLNSVAEITAHVEELRGVALTENDFVPSTELLKVLDKDDMKIASNVMEGRILNKLRPEYPERAKRNRMNGRVLLDATIGTDGKIRTLKVISASDPDFANAALAAVRHWTYHPFPVEVRTTITVNFKIDN